VNGTPADDSCLLRKGDHPFVNHDSFVDYRFTRLEQAEVVQERVQKGVFIEKDACSPELIKRIIQGALKSRRISREHKRILELVLFGE
jgi:DNA-binding transcriptional regulator YhcF (GntR family)